MLWPATLSVLTALFAAATGLTGGAGDGSLPKARLSRYLEELVRGLKNDTVKNDVSDQLKALPHEEVERLHAVCCRGNSGCDVNAAAFLVRERARFTRDDVGTFAVFLKSRFLDLIKDLSDIPLDLSHPEHLDEAALLKGLGKWYEDVQYEIKNDEALKEAVSYGILSDESEGSKGSRAKILLRLVGRERSKVLLDYWIQQPASRQLAVYINALRGKTYGDLAIIQPIIFDMTCVRNGNCTKESYERTLEFHVRSIDFPDGLIVFSGRHRYCLCFSKVTEALRRMTERTILESLVLGEADLVQLLVREWELPAELASQVMAHSSDASLGHRDGVILDPKKIETWKVLDRQLWEMVGPELFILESKAYYYFPPARITKYLVKRGVSPADYVEQYKTVVVDILQRLLRLNTWQWSRVESKLQEYLKLNTFWQLLAFLEASPQYGGLFGATILWHFESWREGVGGPKPKDLEALVQGIINDPVTESRQEKLDALAEQIVAQEIQRSHIYFEDRYKLAREQCRNGLSTIFKESHFASSSFEEHVLSIPAEAGEPGGLYDLQVALVAGSAHSQYAPHGSDADLLKMLELMGKYSTKQLENIYRSDREIYPFFKHSQFCEFDPQLFEFNRPVDKSQAFTLLSKIYQQAHPGRKSIFGLLLDDLGRSSESEQQEPVYFWTVSPQIQRISRNRDFLGNSDGCWQELERSVYTDRSHSERLDAVKKFGPKLTTESLVIEEYKINTWLYKTFDELLEAIIQRGKTQ